MWSLLNKYKEIVFLSFFVLFIVILNYTPGTILMGWDNLQTDLAPWLGIKRAFWSVWQEYQSFGLVSGLAHASDLVRAVLTGVASLFLPQNLVRYFMHALYLLSGAIGSYVLIKQILHHLYGGKKDSFNSLAVIGSMAYLLNMGTIQIFSLPFEPFSVFFAILPWALWSMSKKNKVLFVAIQFLLTPAFYVQTLFLVYLLISGTFLLGLYLAGGKRNLMQWIKKSLGIFSLIILVNAFWLLPQMYFVVKGYSQTVSQAKINLISTEDVFIQNKEKGTVQDFLSNKGFYLDLKNKDEVAIFQTWNDHLHNPFVVILSWLTIITSLIGIFGKKKNFLFFVPSFILFCLIFLSRTPPFTQLNELIRQIGIINQLFRSPFTKFVIPYSLFSALFLSIGIHSCATYLENQFEKIRKEFIYVFFAFAILALSAPVFSGNFYSSYMKVTIPDGYQKMFSFFKTVDRSKRIALLPDYTYWGWFHHRWGYTGSGFLWYGIEQPIVSRTFDTFSTESESYHWQLVRAIELQDPVLLEKVLDKYAISYLILDTSLQPVATSDKALQYEKIVELLSHVPSIRSVASFDPLMIYERETSTDTDGSIISHSKNISPQEKRMNIDTAYTSPYITDTKVDSDEYYPFRNFFSESLEKDRRWKIVETEKSFQIQTDVPKKIWSSNYSLLVPQDSYSTSFFDGTGEKKYELTIETKRKNNSLIIEVPKTSLVHMSGSEGIDGVCEKNKNYGLEKKNGSLEINSYKNANPCFGYYNQFLSHEYGYILKNKTQHGTGRNLSFFVQDATNKFPIMENKILSNTDYLIIPEREKYGTGYSIIFNSPSTSYASTINSIESVDWYSFPVSILQEIRFQKNTDSPVTTSTKNAKSVEKYTYYAYVIQLSGVESNDVVRLNQSYENGWLAYSVPSDTFLNRNFPFFFGQKLTDHVLVNNWANGWKLYKVSQKLVGAGQKLDDTNSTNLTNSTSSTMLVLLFWPQYLQYLGYILLLGVIGWVGIKKFK